MKRVFDFIISLIGVIVLSPIILIVALAVKFTSPGPMLFKQRRIGKNNVEFEATLLTSQPVVVSQDEALDALVALGYSLQESKEAVQKCKKDGLNTEDIIKKSLSYLMNKSLR